MMTIVVPSALVAQGSALEVSAARMQATLASASPAITALAPAGLDEVSALAASAFSAHGGESASTVSLAQSEQLRSATKLVSDAALFAASDVAAAGPIAAAGAE